MADSPQSEAGTADISAAVSKARKASRKAKKTQVQDQIDFTVMTDKGGCTLLKFSRRGDARENVFYLSGDMQKLSWWSRIFSFKFGGKQEVDFEKVLKIERGQKTPQFQRLAWQYGLCAEKSFSIYYLDRYDREQTLDLMCPNAEIFKKVYGALRAVFVKFQMEKRNSYLDRKYMKRLWFRADTDRSGTLTTTEVVALIQNMKLGLSKEKTLQLFKKADLNNDNLMQLSEFENFIRLLTDRPELENIWSIVIRGESFRKVFSDALSLMKTDPIERNQAISIAHFIRFWDECQGEGLVEAQALVLLSDVLKEYVPAGDELSVSYLMWMALITGPKNELFAPAYQNQFDGFCRGKPTPIFPVPVSSGAVQITVNVLSAHQLPLVDIGEDDIELYTHDPYCVVNVVGLDEDVFTARTPTVWNNGFNPFWNEVYTFRCSNPDAAILNFTIMDESATKDSLIACSSTPVKAIRSGLRSVSLFDEAGARPGEYSNSYLLVRICIVPI